MTQEPNEAKQTHRRVLILGSSNHTRLVTAYEWDNLPANLNVADFDTVFLNLVPFQDQTYANTINADLMPKWSQFASHMFSDNSEIVVIGSPNIRIGVDSFLPSTWWLPMYLKFEVTQTGEDIRNIRQDFAFYFALVRRWSFYFMEEGGSHPYYCEYLERGAPSADSHGMQLLPLAETRFHRPIGFEFHLLAQRMGEYHGVPAAFPVKQSGELYWLPEPTEVSTGEAIDLILRKRYDFRFEKTPPEWISGFQLPSRLSILKGIEEKESVIAALRTRLDNDYQELTRASRFLKLLYEQGEDVLEPIARDALRELGAEVDDPKVKGREDGRLIDPSGRKGMLEIKGRTGTLKLSDVRELDQWVRDAIADEDWHSKGILIVDLQCEEDPHKRKNSIPTNCAKTAHDFDISILTTTQLFQALVSDQKGELDREGFWDRVFSAKGICDLPEIE